LSICRIGVVWLIGAYGAEVHPPRIKLTSIAGRTQAKELQFMAPPSSTMVDSWSSPLVTALLTEGFKTSTCGVATGQADDRIASRRTWYYAIARIRFTTSATPGTDRAASTCSRSAPEWTEPAGLEGLFDRLPLGARLDLGVQDQPRIFDHQPDLGDRRPWMSPECRQGELSQGDVGRAIDAGSCGSAGRSLRATAPSWGIPR
jgi:hypothetical protein